MIWLPRFLVQPKLGVPNPVLLMKCVSCVPCDDFFVESDAAGCLQRRNRDVGFVDAISCQDVFVFHPLFVFVSLQLYVGASGSQS